MKTARCRLISFLTLLLLTGCRFSLFDLLPNPGSLDDSFGSGGKVVTPVGTGQDMCWAVAAQDDGKIVAAGYTHNGSTYDFALARYNTDGTLDASFGPSGVVPTDFGLTNEYCYAVAVQPDGKIVAAGYCHNGSNKDFALVRYNTDGTIDTPFGSGGIVRTDFNGADDYGHAVAVQSDGKIVVAGYCDNGSNDDFALARYNPDGSPDTSFGSSSNGKVTTDFVSADDYGRAVAIQEDGKIVAAGYCHNGSYDDFALVRYNIDGTLDLTFGSGGTVTQDIAFNDLAYAITIQKDQKIVVAGYSESGGGFTRDFALIRRNTDGSLDASFGSGGIVTTDIAVTNDFGHAVALQDDGKIMVAGDRYNGLNNDFALVRYNIDGTPDASFGSDGRVITSFGSGDSFGYALAIQPDGMIVAAGYYNNGTDDDFALACYWP